MKLGRLSGQWILLTGATSGIGEQFARQLAARGSRLVLVARSAERLAALAGELSGQHALEVETIAVDLAGRGAAAEIGATLTRLGVPVDVLINNAGFGTAGDFVSLDPATIEELLAVNLATPLKLTRHLLPGMIARGTGAVLNVASVAGFQPTPSMAVYAAAKAAVLSFSRALAEEVRGRGVRVVALCPGTTRTPFFSRAGVTRWDRFGAGHEPERVARAGLRALETGKPVRIVGVRNRVTVGLVRHLPQDLMVRVSAAFMRRRLG